MAITGRKLLYEGRVMKVIRRSKTKYRNTMLVYICKDIKDSKFVKVLRKSVVLDLHMKYIEGGHD